MHNALVALYTSPEGFTIAIDQGLTDQQGQIIVYGAAQGDTIRAATFDGSLAGSVSVISGITSYQVNLASTSASGLAAQASTSTPYLSVIPGSGGDTLFLSLYDAPAGGLPLDALVIPGEGGGSSRAIASYYVKLS